MAGTQSQNAAAPENTQEGSCLMQRVVKELTSDLSGSTEDVRTVRFSLFGTNYEIELAPHERKELQEATARFTEAAREVSAASGLARTPKQRTQENRDRSSRIRDWARRNSIAVSDRGRIAQSVIDQYEAR
jgi:Lsr2